MTSRQKWLGGICALAVLCIWTSFILIARGSARHALTAFDIAFLRFLFSGLAVLPLVAWRARKASRLGAAIGGLNLRQVLALGAVAGIGYCLLAYNGFFLAPVAHGAVLLPGSLPLWTALLAALFLHEPLSRSRMLGLALIVLGDLLVGGASLMQAFEGGSVWKGDLLFLGAAATWSCYAVLCRKWGIGPVDATLAIALSSLILFVPPYAVGVAAGWWPSGLAHAGWAEIMFQGVYQGGLAMLVAGFAFTQVVASFGPVRTTMITALVPVLAALAAVPLLDEPLTALPLAGLVCVTLGLSIGLRAARRIAPRALKARTA